MHVNLTSAARVHNVTETKVAQLIQAAVEAIPFEGGFSVDFHEGRAYIWKDGELLADATL